MKDKLSRLVRDIPPSVIARRSSSGTEPREVISLGIGEPDFGTPEEVCLAALNDARSGHTHYTSAHGDPELVKALVEHINAFYGLSLDPANVLVTNGGMGGLNAFFRAVLDPGDQVLVPEPHFAMYRRNIEFAGGEVVHVPTGFEDGWRLTVEAVERAITPRAKALLLNSPNNPTGAVIPGSTLKELARLVQEKDLLVISDEVYNRFLFNGRPHESIYNQPGMEERTCVLDSFSKTFAMTGWRLGWAFGPSWLIRGMLMVAAYDTISASSISQRAALAALRLDPAVVALMVKEFGRRLDLAYKRLSGMPGVKVHKPAGTFYIFPNFEEYTADSQDFARKLLDRWQVVTLPGASFGPSGTSCLRMACTVPEPKLHEAMDRLENFLGDVKV